MASRLARWRRYGHSRRPRGTRPAVGGRRSGSPGCVCYVSVPLFQFRWSLVLALDWIRFSGRWPPRAAPDSDHPDRVGGLAFCSNTVYAFARCGGARRCCRMLATASSTSDHPAGFQGRARRHAHFSAVRVLGPLLLRRSCAGEADGQSRIRHAASGTCASRHQMAAWGAPAEEPLVGSATSSPADWAILRVVGPCASRR